jgi:starch synthase
VAAAPRTFRFVATPPRGTLPAMKIVLAGSEMSPMARTGGLGDVLEGLPAALAARGHEVSVVLPCYRGLHNDPRLKAQNTGVRITVPVGGTRRDAGILQGEAPNGVQVFLVRRDEYFDRAGLYGEAGHDYSDNAERYIFFSRVLVELVRRVVPSPEIVHVHDWQTALVSVLLKERGLPVTTVLTIHNLAYQGSFWGVDFALTNLPPNYWSAQGVEFYGRLNLLKGGILFADALTTVSEQYAQEIRTPEFGCGLDAVVREHAGKLHGILNGADYAIWDPATDPLLPHRFTPDDLSGKARCREALLAEVGLDPNPRGPVLAIVSRLAEQKGIDILLPIIDRLLADDVRLVVLGEGDTAYERDLMIACKRHPQNFAYRKSMDDTLSHLIEAGSDITLIPSRFEPCGLTAIYSLKYGTLPIARATGGLHQIIQDYDPSTDSGTGFFFFEYTPEAFWDAIVRAKRCFRDTDVWSAIQQRAMAADFSWEKAVGRYEAVYRDAVRKAGK